MPGGEVLQQPQSASIKHSGVGDAQFKLYQAPACFDKEIVGPSL